MPRNSSEDKPNSNFNSIQLSLSSFPKFNLKNNISTSHSFYPQMSAHTRTINSEFIYLGCA